MGPFLVVTRDGRFVTCLGAGMSPGDLPILARGQLDGITAKVATYRARIEARDKLLGPEGEMGRLMERIGEAGPDLSREEFIAIASVQPMLARTFLRHAAESTATLNDARDVLLRLLRRTSKLKAKNNRLLEAHWKLFWAIGHLSVLAAMGGREMLDDFLKDPGDVMHLLVMLPWTARAAPEELYLPADFIKASRTRWRPEDSMHLLARHAEEDKRPVKKPEGPSRSGPCPCGSGKKYKRCCGEEP